MKATVLRPQGDLDLKGSSLLHQMASNLVLKEHNSCWIIDLGKVKNINNFGLLTLMAVRKMADKNRCKLYLLNLQEELQYIFEVTGFSQEFEILENGEVLHRSNLQLLLC